MLGQVVKFISADSGIVWHTFFLFALRCSEESSAPLLQSALTDIHRLRNRAALADVLLNDAIENSFGRQNVFHRITARTAAARMCRDVVRRSLYLFPRVGDGDSQSALTHHRQID